MREQNDDIFGFQADELSKEQIDGKCMTKYEMQKKINN